MATTTTQTHTGTNAEHCPTCGPKLATTTKPRWRKDIRLEHRNSTRVARQHQATEDTSGTDSRERTCRRCGVIGIRGQYPFSTGYAGLCDDCGA